MCIMLIMFRLKKVGWQLDKSMYPVIGEVIVWQSVFLGVNMR